MNNLGQQNLALRNDARIGAFLQLIAYSEGTLKGNSIDYGKLVYDSGANGAAKYGNFADHPAHYGFIGRATIKGRSVPSTAAGGYQFLLKTWQGLKAQLALTDFKPDTQDAAAIQLLRQCGALGKLQVNDFDGAVYAARKIWASFPGAGYNQHERGIEQLRKVYQSKLGGNAPLMRFGNASAMPAAFAALNGGKSVSYWWLIIAALGAIALLSGIISFR